MTFAVKSGCSYIDTLYKDSTVMCSENRTRYH